MQENNIKERIIGLLEERNYGLTIEEISKFLEISRSTASKYLAVLEAEKKLVVRDIGKAKLHYLSSDYGGNNSYILNKDMSTHQTKQLTKLRE